VNKGGFLAMVHPLDREAFEEAMRRSLEGHVEFQLDYRAIRPDGSVCWISSRGRTFYDHTGAPVRMVGTALDVTPQKLAEQERAELLARERAALAEAQSATRVKDEFLAVLSHELRTPLQSICGWTQILKPRAHDVELVQKGLATIERNVRTQTQLIEDLLDVSRIVAGNLHLSCQRVNLVDVIASSLESMTAPAEAKSIRLDAVIEPVEGVVLGDPERLQQVVVNLLTNAVKFTPSGGRVEVRLDRAGTTGRIVVEDTGRGMAPEFIPYAFDRLRQEETGTTRRQGGLGLGLSIVRNLVEMHGGTVKAESPGEGRGATFTVTLPLVSAEAERLA
jgi:signal transduction histidine kinase